jgi:hypothetical protein
MADKAFMSFTQNGEQVGLGHSLLVGGDTMEYRALVSDVAKKIIEDYAGSTLAGSAQSVQSALASLNSKLPQFGSFGYVNLGSSATVDSLHDYVDNLPNVNSVNIGVIFISGGARVCIVQKYQSGSYASILEFGYFLSNVRFHKKASGTWDVYNLTQTKV